MLILTYFHSSPQDSPWQLVIAEGFVEANSVFIVITLAKILRGDYFLETYSVYNF